MPVVQKPERVYFLGAGASKAIYPDDLPLAKDLTLQSLLEYHDADYRQNASRSLRDLRPLLAGPLRVLASERMEDVLSKEDLPQEVRNNAIQCILYRLGLLDRPPCSALQAWLVQMASKGHAIVTTNYDTVVERNLRRKRDPGDSSHGKLALLDYGIAADLCVKQGDGDLWRGCESDKPLLLLKLHGSISWARCVKCNRYMLHTTYALGGAHAMEERPHISEACPDCGGAPWSVIVPPVKNKKYDDSALQQVWNRADEILRNAQEMVFVGYSLPRTDETVRAMLRRAHESSNMQKVLVIDRNPGTVAEELRGIYGDVVSEAGSDWRRYIEEASTAT